MMEQSEDRSDGGEAAQEPIVALLTDPRTHGLERGRVDHIVTHGAHVFLAGDDAYKMKRAITLPYMDFSTLARRKSVIAREFAINLPNAPDVYLGVIPVTRQSDGTLALGGGGVAVEWLLHMRRFDDADILASMARNAPLADTLATATADAVYDAHANAPVVTRDDGGAMIAELVADLAANLGKSAALLGKDDIVRWANAFDEGAERIAPLLDRRGRTGCLRRCHGDLHAGNIAIVGGKPILFDALEFDERLATTDILYDLAFLLMDLCRLGQRRAANIVLNRYLWRDGQLDTLDGLRAMPLFLGLRAAVRALVSADRAASTKDDAASANDARDYLARAMAHLLVPPPTLIAVGGLSGSGKSRLAADLAPRIGAAPGAVHLRSDLERKSLFGREDIERLPAAAYDYEVTRSVYDILLAKADRALEAGATVLVDAVNADEAERDAVEAVAARRGATFQGFWLDVPTDVRAARVSRRTGDASDATVDVAIQQDALQIGCVAWRRIDASGKPAETLGAVLHLLGAAVGP
ncbi:MAG: AAA family ATPase [Hyphomicrobium sp.]|nr:AAA family ATPase [Hyphomicrobium sp.]